MKIYRFESTTGEIAYGTNADVQPGGPIEKLSGDLFAGMLHGRGVFEKEHRELRKRRVRLGGVMAVVQADAEQRARIERREQPAHDRLFARELEAAQEVAAQLPDLQSWLHVGRSAVSEIAGGRFIAIDFHMSALRM